MITTDNKYISVSEGFNLDSLDGTINNAVATKNMGKNDNKKLGNASAWRSLAKRPPIGSDVQQPPRTSLLKTNTDNLFLAFKKQAEAKVQKEKTLMEQQEIRRTQKKLIEKQNMTIENESRQKKEKEEIHGKNIRFPNRVAPSMDESQSFQQTPVCISGPKLTGNKNSSLLDESIASPEYSHGKISSERARLRQQEQERRRREAMENRIDVLFQSNCMAEFERTIGLPKNGWHNLYHFM